MDLRLDEIGFGGLEIYQCPQEFCYGVDAVLLADFATSSTAVKEENLLQNHGFRHGYRHCTADSVT